MKNISKSSLLIMFFAAVVALLGTGCNATMHLGIDTVSGTTPDVLVRNYSTNKIHLDVNGQPLVVKRGTPPKPMQVIIKPGEAFGVYHFDLFTLSSNERINVGYKAVNDEGKLVGVGNFDTYISHGYGGGYSGGVQTYTINNWSMQPLR